MNPYARHVHAVHAHAVHTHAVHAYVMHNNAMHGLVLHIHVNARPSHALYCMLYVTIYSDMLTVAVGPKLS
jgi:hypothetical protein